MSKPWHDEIAALSLLHLIRDNMGERRGSSRRVEVEVEREGRVMERSGRRDTRWEEGLQCGERYNKKGGRGKRAHLERGEGKTKLRGMAEEMGDTAGASAFLHSLRFLILCFFLPPFSSSLSSSLSRRFFFFFV